MTEYTGVMIYCETAEGNLSSITTELLSCGRKLAYDLGHELYAALVGTNIGNLAQEAIAFGADKVYVAEGPLLKNYQTDSYVSVTEMLVKKAMPQILLLGQTSIGRDLAPRLAFRLHTTVLMGCVELAIDPDSKQLLSTKPVYGGNAYAIFSCQSYPQMATLRGKVMSPLERDNSRQGEIIRVEADLDQLSIRTKFIEKYAEPIEGIRLEDARTIVTGGRGIGGAAGFEQLKELARLIDGALGATRPPCDNDWVPKALQIGLTGKVVSPDFYIAVALSGSSQHLCGISGAKNIIAINKDPEADIFKVAHYGLVGDWKEVMPAFINKVEELLGK